MLSPSWTKKIKVLVWDLDKTLYPDIPEITIISREIIFQEIADVLKVTLDKAREVFLNQKKKLFGDTISLLSLGVDAYKVQTKIMERIRWERYIKPDKKLQQLFNGLKKHWHIMASDNTQKSALIKLNLLGLKPDIFKKMFLGIDLKVLKPDPKLYKKVLNYTKMPPEAHLMIGDSLKKDILPAKSLGMRTCLVWKQNELADISLEKVYDVVKLFK